MENNVFPAVHRENVLVQEEKAQLEVVSRLISRTVCLTQMHFARCSICRVGRNSAI